MTRDEKNKLNQAPSNSQTLPNNFPELKTQKEAAALFGKSVVSFWRLRKQYGLTMYRVGGSARFALSDLLDLLNKMRVEV